MVGGFPTCFLVGGRRTGRLYREELEAQLVSQVLFEQARALDGDFDIIPNLSLPREAGEARRKGAGDMSVEQLLAPIHEPDSAEQTRTREASSAGEPANPCHGLRIAADIIERKSEAEFPLMLARLKEHRDRICGDAVIGKDLLDLVQDFVVLMDNLRAVGDGVPAADRGLWRIVSVEARVWEAEGGFALAFELDDDGGDRFCAADAQNHLARYYIEIGVEFGRVGEGNADGHSVGPLVR